MVIVALMLAAMMLIGCSEQPAASQDDTKPSDEPKATEQTGTEDFDPSQYAIAICTYPTSNPSDIRRFF